MGEAVLFLTWAKQCSFWHGRGSALFEPLLEVLQLNKELIDLGHFLRDHEYFCVIDHNFIILLYNNYSQLIFQLNGPSITFPVQPSGQCQAYFMSSDERLLGMKVACKLNDLSQLASEPAGLAFILCHLICWWWYQFSVRKHILHWVISRSNIRTAFGFAKDKVCGLEGTDSIIMKNCTNLSYEEEILKSYMVPAGFVHLYVSVVLWEPFFAAFIQLN